MSILKNVRNWNGMIIHIFCLVTTHEWLNFLTRMESYFAQFFKNTLILKIILE